MTKSAIIINLIILFVLGFLVYLNTVDVENTIERLAVVEAKLIEVKFHYKEPCLTIPEGSQCAHKTMFFRLPGGSMQKAIRRVCWWESDGIAQEWMK